jgi:hypothetical protein
VPLFGPGALRCRCKAPAPLTVTCLGARSAGDPKSDVSHGCGKEATGESLCPFESSAVAISL